VAVWSRGVVTGWCLLVWDGVEWLDGVELVALVARSGRTIADSKQNTAIRH